MQMRQGRTLFTVAITLAALGLALAAWRRAETPPSASSAPPPPPGRVLVK